MTAFLFSCIEAISYLVFVPYNKEAVFVESAYFISYWTFTYYLLPFFTILKRVIFLALFVGVLFFALAFGLGPGFALAFVLTGQAAAMILARLALFFATKGTSSSLGA